MKSIDLLCFILYQCLIGVYSLNTYLNVDEINSIHYDIDIMNKPVLKDQVSFINLLLFYNFQKGFI